MKQISIGCIMLMALWGCNGPSVSPKAEDQDTAAHVGADEKLKGEEIINKPEKDQAKLTTGEATTLKGLEGLTLETGMEIDDFRGRLEHDWGDVHNILRASGAEFKPEGANFLVMEGEIKQGNFPWSAIMIIDLNQDAVFAAQFDGENKRIDQFEEEKEGLSQPAPLTRWTKDHQ